MATGARSGANRSRSSYSSALRTGVSPAACNWRQTATAASRESSRPVWATIRTCRSAVGPMKPFSLISGDCGVEVGACGESDQGANRIDPLRRVGARPGQPNQILPVPCAPRDGRWGDSRGAQTEIPGGPQDVRDGILTKPLIANDPLANPAAADLELWLHEQDEVGSDVDRVA